MTIPGPSQVANDGLTSGDTSPSMADLRAALPGIDLPTVTANVVRLGGRREPFAHWLAAGLAGGGTDPVDLIGIAGWRAGALALRDDALARVERLAAGEARESIAATLGIAEGDLDEFVARQRTDRWWWPGRDDAQGYVLSVGGFAGLGGAWTAPADAAVALEDDDGFAIRAGERWWRLESDAWCSRLLPLEVPPQGQVSNVRAEALRAGVSRWTLLTDAARPGLTVSIVQTRDSYLLWLLVETR